MSISVLINKHDRYYVVARDERRKPHWKPPVNVMKGKSVSSKSGSGTVTVFLAGNQRYNP